jgi:hypothetical protein
MTRIYGAVLGVDGDRLRLWAPGYTPDSGHWVVAPEGFPEALRYEGATFEVEFDTPGMPWGGRFSHQHGCDCAIHKGTDWDAVTL